MDYLKLIDDTLRWKEIDALARIHGIFRCKSIKGRIKVRRNKAEVTKDIRRALCGTFPDRVARTKQILDWYLLTRWGQAVASDYGMLPVRTMEPDASAK